MPDLALRGITERDVDLLIAEELVASPGFTSWCASRLGVDARARLTRVERSVLSATRGESDLVLSFERDGRVTKVLIENKIDAVFQPRQAERYRERAAEAVAARECAEARIAVFAPASYERAEDGFDAKVLYEELRAWFVNEASGDARSQCKVSLLDAALDRGRGGWILIPDRAATDFWREYWELASKRAPELRLPEPDKKPATSSFLRFRPSGLAKGVSLVHKVPYGNVDLQFAGHAGRLDDYRRRFRDGIERGMVFEVAGKSLVNRLTVKPVPLRAPFAESRRAVEEALSEALRLLAWYRREVEPAPPDDGR